MITELHLMADEDKLAAWQNKYPFVDAKEEVLGEWQCYFDSSLLAFEPLTREFTEAELESIRSFTTEVQSLTVDDWKTVAQKARTLLDEIEK